MLTSLSLLPAGCIDDLGWRDETVHEAIRARAGVRVNTHSIRVTRHQKHIADARTKLEAIRILANADRLYWLLHGTHGELRVHQDLYELARKQLDRAQKRVAAQSAPRVEITRAESGLAASLEGIIVAETTLRRRERDLKRLMNRDDLPMSGPAALIPTTSPNPVGLDLDANALADFAVDNRMEMLELELRLAIDASTIDFERNGTLPLVVLDYTYGINGLGRSFNEAFRGIGAMRFEDWSVQLRAEVPLGNEAAKARLRRAMWQRVQRLATRDQRQVAIRQEVHDAVDQLEQDWQRILAARQEAILAGRTYEAERRQFDLGVRTSTDVLQAAERLARAQSREIRALTDYQISNVDIAFATGTLLGHGRVDWAP